MRKTFFLKKRFISKIFKHLFIHLNSGLKSLLGKKLIKNKYSKINFWSIFILFFYFFFKKTFLFLRYLKKQLQILKRRNRLPIRVCHQIPANSSNGGPGGRLAPPAFKCHKKKCRYVGSRTLLTDCVFWAYLPVVEVRTICLLKLENYTEKTKKS